MTCGPGAQQRAVALCRSGRSERDIVSRVQRQCRCDDKTVRRCAAGIDLIRHGATGRENDLTGFMDGILGAARLASSRPGSPDRSSSLAIKPFVDAGLAPMSPAASGPCRSLSQWNRRMQETGAGRRHRKTPEGRRNGQPCVG